MHKTIKRFGMEGEVGDDADFPRLRSQFEQLILTEMREAGYVPVLDLGPYWSTTFTDGTYQFVLSIYGTHVGGKKSAWEIEGISDGKMIPRTTLPRSNQS